MLTLLCYASLLRFSDLDGTAVDAELRGLSQLLLEMCQLQEGGQASRAGHESATWAVAKATEYKHIRGLETTSTTCD